MEKEKIDEKNQNGEDRCCLSTCGHYCNMCHPILQQLLLLCHKCMSKYEQHPVREFFFHWNKQNTIR